MVYGLASAASLSHTNRPLPPIYEDLKTPMLPKLTAWPEHPVFAATAAAKAKTKHPPAAAGGKPKLGNLPEWNLADLYNGPDAPELKADLASSESAADAMQSRYAAKLAKLLDGGKGGAEDKIEAMKSAGIVVADSPAESTTVRRTRYHTLVSV